MIFGEQGTVGDSILDLIDVENCMRPLFLHFFLFGLL
jgi:hypothetical protein